MNFGLTIIIEIHTDQGDLGFSTGVLQPSPQ